MARRKEMTQARIAPIARPMTAFCGSWSGVAAPGSALSTNWTPSLALARADRTPLSWDWSLARLAARTRPSRVVAGVLSRERVSSRSLFWMFFSWVSRRAVAVAIVSSWYAWTTALAISAAWGMSAPEALTITTPLSGLVDVFTAPRSAAGVSDGPFLDLMISAARPSTGAEPANAARWAV
ncbi:hypothetical protein EBO15_23680 [Actinomadura harenae]|uniref:Uncharacterized protein n=1 Tax=Actinomadura harenae TaxID=2483351 RepID=A0A3M2LVM4_9ACTN|nr:hypothetical protein EBO15_23680 [Actinomadura harenae]